MGGATAAAWGRTTSAGPELAGTLRRVKLADIRDAPHNPKGRTRGKHLKDLAASILDVGLFYPVILDRHHMLIDGHRRVAAGRSAGWKYIWAFVCDVDFEHAYGEINSTHLRLSGNDLLGVYLKSPNALARRQKRFPEQIANTVGWGWLRRLYEAGLGYWAYGSAVRLVCYCKATKEPDPEHVKLALEWLAKHNYWKLARAFRDNGVDQFYLWRAVEKGVPVAFQLKEE